MFGISKESSTLITKEVEFQELEIQFGLKNKNQEFKAQNRSKKACIWRH